MNEKYSIRYSSLFTKDLKKNLIYLIKTLNNPYAAKRLLKELDKKSKFISKNPKICPRYISYKKRKFSYYKLNIKNYVLFYIVKDNVVEFRRIVFGSRNFKNLI